MKTNKPTLLKSIMEGPKSKRRFTHPIQSHVKRRPPYTRQFHTTVQNHKTKAKHNVTTERQGGIERDKERAEMGAKESN
jgi:hypothetical protein